MGTLHTMQIIFFFTNIFPFFYFPKNPLATSPFFHFPEKGMEGGDQNLGNGGSRWNPTKEQINMLESLYSHGLRTPTAEQIQEITARLRDYGHIEGKNVFYWFQNHKARQRQRQKQKQQSFAFYNRFLHAPASPLYPSFQNVICSPCYIPPPKNEAVYYQQQPKVQVPNAQGTFKRSRIIPQSIDSSMQSPTNQRYSTKSMDWISSSSHHNQETLDLFPIHPTGILKSRTGEEDDDLREIKNPNHHPSVLLTSTDKERYGDHPFFDFFCGN